MSITYTKSTVKWILKIFLPWLCSSVGYSVIPIPQLCGFSSQSRYIQESINECKDRWGHQLLSLCVCVCVRMHSYAYVFLFSLKKSINKIIV